ncbi:MAG: serine/threonine-protein kinase [Spirochaetota bacterium]
MIEQKAAERYTLIERLGSGGTAEVYKAEDVQLGRIVALKRFHPHFLDDRVLAARVHAEVALATRLSHPGIAAVHELAHHEGSPGIVMEYLPGGDLRRRILSRGRLTAGETEGIARPLLEALAYAHERGIVHRDIKPRNVLFGEDGSPKLVDFGLARSMSSAGLAERDTVAGTAEYTAPETITASLWDARSDLYALGCTLYEALTGRPPFVANSPPEVLRMHVEEPLPDIADVLGPEVARDHTSISILIATLLQKDPNDRPQTAREALRILAETGTDLPTLTGSRPGGSPTHAWSGSPGARNTVRCPSCGAAMSPRYGWCFTCHKPAVQLVAAKRGGTSVFVVGPGKRGEKLPSDQRDACSEVAGAMGLRADSIRKRVPRLPFVFARGLERASAVRLRQELETRGVDVRLVGPGDASRWVGGGMILRKALTMTPRIYLVVAGMSGGFFQGFAHGSSVAPFAVLGAVLLGVPVVSALGYRRSATRLVSRCAPEQERLHELLVSVDDPLIHARVKNVVESGASLIEASTHDDSLPDDLRDDVARVVLEGVERAAALGLALDDVRRSDQYARHTGLLAHREGAAADAERSASIVRGMDSLYTQTLERIGSVALDLHETAVRLAGRHRSLTHADVTRLREGIGRLSDAGEAWRELELDLGGGA